MVFYEEKIPVDLTPEVSETDERNFKFSVHGNKFEFVPDKRKIYHNPVAKFFVKLFNGIIKTTLFIVTIALIPFFIDQPDFVSDLGKPEVRIVLS